MSAHNFFNDWEHEHDFVNYFGKLVEHVGVLAETYAESVKLQKEASNCTCTQVRSEREKLQEVAKTTQLEGYCKSCGHPTSMVMVEYPLSYDGWSEIECPVCHKRWGRWSGKELELDEHEDCSLRHGHPSHDPKEFYSSLYSSL